MAEFIAMHQTDASLLACLLASLRGQLALGGTANASGVGFFQSDDVLLRKRPLAGPAIPEKLAEGVESEAVLICAGSAGQPAAFNEQHALPFRFKRWLFATAGQPDLSPVRAPLLEALPPSLRRSVRGDSGAEAVFFNFLARLRDAGHLDDHDVDARTAARSLAAAVGAAERGFEQNGAPLPPLAAVVTNGRVLAALRRGHALAVGNVEGVLPCARCELGPEASDLDPRVHSHRTLRALVLQSGEPAPEGFRALGEGEVLAAARDLSVSGA